MWSTRVCLVVLCCCVYLVCSRRYESRCKLVRELMRLGIPNDMFLGQWVCLIEKTSNRNTSAFVVSPSGKKFYGLYQIPSRWCKENKRGGDCNMKCEDLLNEDIRDDTACAVKIYQQEGFKYWPAWTTRCKNDHFITNEIYKCPDLRYSPDRSSPVSMNYSDQSISYRFKRDEEENNDSTIESNISRFFKVIRLQSRQIN